MKLDDHTRDVVGRAFFDGQLDDGLRRLLGRLVVFAEGYGLVVGDCVPNAVAGNYEVFVERAEDVSHYVWLACHAEAFVGDVAEGPRYCEAACHSAIHYFPSCGSYSIDFLRVRCFVILR